MAGPAVRPLLELEVVTPKRRVLQATAESVLLPGSEGYLGILAGHAPLVAGLAIGTLAFGDRGRVKQTLAVSGGFVEVAGNKVTVLADAAERPEEIDVARARAARERALRRLRQRSAEIDHARAEAALRRALNRLKVAGQGGAD